MRFDETSIPLAKVSGIDGQTDLTVQPNGPGHVVHHYPAQPRFGTVTVRCARAFEGILAAWSKEGPQKAARTVTVSMLDSDGQVRASWSLTQAWPRKVGDAVPGAHGAGGDLIAELAYVGLVRTQ